MADTARESTKPRKWVYHHAMRLWDTLEFFMLVLLGVVVWWAYNALIGIPTILAAVGLQIYKIRAQDAFDQELLEEGVNPEFAEDLEKRERLERRRRFWRKVCCIFEGEPY